MTEETYPVFIIGGPTAGGKSARALDIAAARNGIIINADSMQLYDALPLLTARPTEKDMAQAPHALYATLSTQEKCTAQAWREMALAQIERAHANGQLPIIVGGTGFYIKTLMKGLSPVPAIPAAIRDAATAIHAELGNPGFHEALAKRDPITAGRLHPNDTQRLVRAWEVLDHTGTGLAAWQEVPAISAPDHYKFETQWIIPERATLHARCDDRFDMMMEQGALEEAAAFHKQIESGAAPEDAAVAHALGFRPLQRYLRGEINLENAIKDAKTETRQYAKRQVTWFNNQL